MGWFIICVVLFVILLVLGLCKVSRRKEADAAPTYLDAAIEPFPEEMHPQEAVRFTACITDEEIRMAAQTVFGEARGVLSRMEQAAVVWTLLNRVDDCGDSLGKVITAPNQFKG